MYKFRGRTDQHPAIIASSARNALQTLCDPPGAHGLAVVKSAKQQRLKVMLRVQNTSKGLTSTPLSQSTLINVAHFKARADRSLQHCTRSHPASTNHMGSSDSTGICADKPLKET